MDPHPLRSEFVSPLSLQRQPLDLSSEVDFTQLLDRSAAGGLNLHDYYLAESFEEDGGSSQAEGDLAFDQVIELPPPLLSAVERRIWTLVRARIDLGLPASCRGELLIRATRNALIGIGMGRKVAVPVLFAGINLALAKSQGVPIPTPLRDIARETGVRYSTLLQVRRVALAQIERLGPCLELGIE